MALTGQSKQGCELETWKMGRQSKISSFCILRLCVLPTYEPIPQKIAEACTAERTGAPGGRRGVYDLHLLFGLQMGGGEEERKEGTRHVITSHFISPQPQLLKVRPSPAAAVRSSLRSAV